ncbi:lipid II:glycine glycyltransferase FemX [Thiohalocapsa marina]|uniref:lipid II:glycine glycyltransferase FemX n=1 Tax=Thiohalocapsa marina TaxID=424902 RepID=UPI001479259C|nr:GNAT family N-acetyltransferase [Thiohalocapsa marina]
MEELEAALDELRDVLGQRGFCLMAMSPWFEKSSAYLAHLRRAGAVLSASRHRTIWIDLTQGRDALWQRLDKQWRYGVGRALRVGVSVDTESDTETVNAFFDLCKRVSEAKRFRLPASSGQMLALLQGGLEGAVEARLFIARFRGTPAAGVFVLRCGTTMHYLWGAADRAFSKQRVGEAVQWAAVEWALSQGCRLYDLEGIDPERNPGTYQFKKKMGGREVDLPGEIYVPMGLRGRVIANVLRRRC